MSTSTQHTDKPTRIVEQFVAVVCHPDGTHIRSEAHDTYDLANTRLVRLMQSVQKDVEKRRMVRGIYGKVERRLVIEDA